MRSLWAFLSAVKYRGDVPTEGVVQVSLTGTASGILGQCSLKVQ
jgi:hypothetical protein